MTTLLLPSGSSILKNEAGEVPEGQMHAPNAASFELTQEDLDDRVVTEWNQGLRNRHCVGPEPGPLTAPENHRFDVLHHIA